MRFNILSGLVALLPMTALASPLSAENPGKVQAASALAIVNQLNSRLTTISNQIDGSMAGVTKSSSQEDKDNAVKAVGPELQAMTVAITNAVGELGQKANGLQERQGGGDVNALAEALRNTLSMVSNVVNTLLAVLGLTPLLAFLTPLTGALSGLVLSLKAVVDQLLPILNTILDGVVVGLSQALGGIIL